MNKIIRIFSFKFLNEEKVSYFLLNKKIKNSHLYMKFKHVLKEAIAFPEAFNSMKE